MKTKFKAWFIRRQIADRMLDMLFYAVFTMAIYGICFWGR